MTDEKDLGIKIRRASVTDISALGELGSRLALQHQDYDQLRFTLLEPIVAKHEEFFTAQIKNKDAIVLILEINGEIGGYALIGFEEYSFLELLAKSAWLHDIYLNESARGKNAGKMFLDAIVKIVREYGSDNLMLSVSPHNERARKIFTQYGFRPTMLEMRLDFEDEEK